MTTTPYSFLNSGDILLFSLFQGSSFCFPLFFLGGGVVGFILFVAQKIFF